MSDNEAKAIACFFCEYYTPNREESNKGYCHRCAPRPVYGVDIANPKVYWPEVTVWDWCGEFSRRSGDDKFFKGLQADD